VPLKNFKGTKRRFEFIKDIGGIQLFDDYAHHPLEIKATLKAAKEKFPQRKIIAIFQPHTYSRTKALFADFSKSFKDSDNVILLPIYASAREKETLGMSSQKLAKAIKKFNHHSFFVQNKKQLADILERTISKKTVIFTLGAGDIFNWHPFIISCLRQAIKKIK